MLTGRDLAIASACPPCRNHRAFHDQSQFAASVGQVAPRPEDGWDVVKEDGMGKAVDRTIREAKI
ncbi:hypothetical protein [Bradyrhizobium sp. ORS 375]|uniref:hypothetical protein n=1 Tax=Bradyrhizobium sp. (strain ORS 375) TaxID=566679 RepID=UPI0011125B19|nr:hypothetical protein [Bradyrhizobium sp. ORS 375]